jgi:uncharacterized membrane protein YdjX (TVP38/TMEM64 family)
MDKRLIKNNYSRSPLFHVFLTIVALALVILIFYFYNEGLWRDVIRFCTYFLQVRRLETFIASYGVYAGFMFVALQATQVTIAFIPGDVTGFVGGYLFGNTMGIILSTIGLSLGSLLAFFTARIFGLRLVEKIVKKQYRDRFDYWITHKGLYLMFIFFLIPGFPKDSLCYLLGLSHLRLVPFILMNICRLPGTVLLTMQGAAVDNEEYKTFFFLLAGGLLMTLVLYVMRKYCAKAVDSLVCRALRMGKERSACGDGIQLLPQESLYKKRIDKKD